jgi:hypothetical protein
MISRAQRILFTVMLIAAVAMAAFLIRLRERAQDRLRVVQDSVPLIEPSGSPLESVSLLIPNDTDGSLLPAQRSLPMPKDESARARVLLETLLESFREPHSTHPIADGTSSGANSLANSSTLGINEVYLMPLPQPKGSTPTPGLMAVVDLSAAFAAAHPSGIEPETLTLLAIIGTLHANIPAVTQVRFLVDGHQVETLAGHADLTRTYLASETEPTGR